MNRRKTHEEFFYQFKLLNMVDTVTDDLILHRRANGKQSLFSIVFQNVPLVVMGTDEIHPRSVCFPWQNSPMEGGTCDEEKRRKRNEEVAHRSGNDLRIDVNGRLDSLLENVTMDDCHSNKESKINTRQRSRLKAKFNHRSHDIRLSEDWISS